jgi:hypothetical protein
MPILMGTSPRLYRSFSALYLTLSSFGVVRWKLTIAKA